VAQIDIPPNPDYGDGFFIRSLAIRTPQPNRVLLGMEDEGHAFQVAIEHDGKVVTAVDARWHRHPLSTCPGAPEALHALVGCPLSDNVFAPQHFTDPRQQCTHMFDMIRFALVHAWHGRGDRRYDAIIPDAPEGPQTCRLLANGELLIELQVDGDMIIAPASFKGASFARGFGSWAAANLQPEQREWVLFLQRAYFVSLGRRGDYSAFNYQPVALSGLEPGVCYTTQPGRFEQAVQLPTNRDHSKTPEQVLRFFPLD
jgi:hypothetical protein